MRTDPGGDPRDPVGRGTPPPTHADVLVVRDTTLEWGTRTYVMAILNVTPDSFSGDGLGRDVGAAVDAAERAAADGADILDIGGESTRPGADTVPEAEELERVVPVVAGVRARLAIPISVDTSKVAVAAAALDAGADIVNDVWGLAAEPGLADLVAARGVPIVLMHNRSERAQARLDPTLGGHYVAMDYDNLVGDVVAGLARSADLARAAGVPASRIIVDPGLGFGKTHDQNLELLDRTDRIRELGYPVLVGPSRKSFVGLTLGLPPFERVEGTAACVAVAIARGADIVRVHDVRAMVRVARMTDAVVRRRRASADGRADGCTR